MDDPANPGAQVTLFKRRESGTTEDSHMSTKTAEELAKGLTDAEKQIETLTKAAETNATELAKANDRVKTLEAELEKAKAGKPGDGGEDEIFKGMSPAAVELFKKMQADRKADSEALAKMREKDETTEAINKAKADYPSAPATTPAELGPIMKRVAGNVTTPEDVAKLHQILKASSALVEKALEGGESGTIVLKAATGSAREELETKAHELRKSNSKLSLEDAQAQVMADNPSLAKRYREEMIGPRN